MDLSFLILTDSGGVQEEAPSLGKPVLLMRDTTERPEAVKARNVKLVGTNKQKIFDETMCLLNDPEAYHKMSSAHSLYGDGTACKKIMDTLINYPLEIENLNIMIERINTDSTVAKLNGRVIIDNLTFDNKQSEFDKVYKSKGVKILCDVKSWFYVKGTEIDFSNDMLSGGFKLNNPNANRTCGCGTSFSA